LGYEPNELPLLHPAVQDYKLEWDRQRYKNCN